MSLSERRWAWPALAGVLIAAISLRLWGVGQGLPYVYNLDESDHFVPHAVAMFRHGLDPHYFSNPPALTYLLHVVFAVWFGGASGVEHAYAHSPEDVYLVARVVSAVLGTAAVWLLYLAGARLFDRRVALVAAAIEAFAFLPVFYAHLALNDVPALAPLTLSLLGSAGILRRGRALDYLIAGAGLGLACATKYTAGIVLLPLLAAAAARPAARERASGGSSSHAIGALAGLAIAGAAALAAFLIANPYALIDYQAFHRGLVHQSTVSGESQGKLGAPSDGGLPYYLWSLTWGLGWVPALAALGGALTIWRREPRVGWMLVPPAILYVAFMSLQGRYFGRWLLPIFPLACLLAAFFAFELVRGLARRGPRVPAIALVLAVAALCVQGLVHSVHSSLVLSRADTRNLTRAWMVAHVPAGSRIVVEPVVPNAWVTDIGAGSSGEPRWLKYASLRAAIDPATGAREPEGRRVRPEDYERTLSPALVAYYEQHGYCWVVSGSTQAGRAFADPRAVPQAIAYYRTLEARASVAYRASPYRSGAAPVPFGFDWSFDYYPLAYERPGPQITVYRLSGGACAAPRASTAP
ncbi:MAG TPA: glycosyltransferase family 39 protein [Solirubrobacteraceae bacterium]|nr:glycosyltransferase family 39 protein [Solirubrobacteraceae bacterium]